MSLYRVRFDCEDDFIEAPSFGDALRLWRKSLQANNEPGDIADDQEPETVELLSYSPVIRDTETQVKEQT